MIPLPALVTLAAILAVAILPWWMFRPVPCYVCQKKGARVEIGGYLVCRECWKKLKPAREIVAGLIEDSIDPEVTRKLIVKAMRSTEGETEC